MNAAYFHISPSIFRAIVMKNPGFIIDPPSVQLPVRPAPGNRYMQNILMPTDWEATLHRDGEFMETGLDVLGQFYRASFPASPRRGACATEGQTRAPRAEREPSELTARNAEMKGRGPGRLLDVCIYIHFFFPSTHHKANWGDVVARPSRSFPVRLLRSLPASTPAVARAFFPMKIRRVNSRGICRSATTRHPRNFARKLNNVRANTLVIP